MKGKRKKCRKDRRGNKGGGGGGGGGGIGAYILLNLVFLTVKVWHLDASLQVSQELNDTTQVG